MFKLSFNHKLAALALAVAAVAVAITFGAPDAFAHAVSLHDHPALVTASAALIAMRSEHATLTQSAAAKFAELKDGLPADVVARINTEHAEIVQKIADVQAKITAEEAKAPPAVKPWAHAFYMSAAVANIELSTLNTIVAESVDLAAAKDRLIDAMAKAGNADKPAGNGARADVGTEATAKFVTGATASLLNKVTMFSDKGKPAGERNEFSGMSLRELARVSLDLRGIRNIPYDSMTMVQMAFAPIGMAGALSTSDFTNILANVANKAMLKGYEESPETFDKWTGKGTLTDFKAVSRVDLGLFPSLAKVQEGAEYSYAKMSDRGVTLILATYGKIFPITRQAIINDDLGAFTKIPGKMGGAARRTVGDLVYGLLTANAAFLGGQPLFHASRNNLITGAGSAFAVAALDKARTAMGRQTDPDNIKQGLNIRPAYCLVPITLEGTALQTFASRAEPGQENPAIANRVAGMAEVVSEARLDTASTTAWYLAGNPAQYDTIEVSYLNGVETPTLEQKEGWNVDGAEMKVRLDAGVSTLDFRALLKSDGNG
jgi:hypothetical protein